MEREVVLPAQLVLPVRAEDRWDRPAALAPRVRQALLEQRGVQELLERVSLELRELPV